MANLGCKPLHEESARKLGAPATFCVVTVAQGISTLLNDMGTAKRYTVSQGLPLKQRHSHAYANKEINLSQQQVGDDWLHYEREMDLAAGVDGWFEC